jgi:hypothetical protein
VGNEAMERRGTKSMAGHMKRVLLITLSVSFGLSVFQSIKLKQHKLDIYKNRIK